MEHIEHKTHCYVCIGCQFTTQEALEAVAHEKSLGVVKHATYITEIYVDTQPNDDGTTQIVVKRQVHNTNLKW